MFFKYESKEKVRRSASKGRISPSRRSPSRKSPSRRSPSRRSPSRQSGKSPTRSPILTRKLPIRSTRLAKISLERIDVEGKYMFAMYAVYIAHIFSYAIFVFTNK